jgi:hypothetical protein
MGSITWQLSRCTARPRQGKTIEYLLLTHRQLSNVWKDEFLDIGHEDVDSSASLPNLYSSFGRNSMLATKAKEPASSVCIPKALNLNIRKLT